MICLRNNRAIAKAIRKISVVDDERLMRELYVALLSLRGFEATTATSAEEALRLPHVHPGQINLL
ncbi:MAG: response regulator [Limisphaerales bacterium]